MLSGYILHTFSLNNISLRGGGFCEAKLGGVVKENNSPPADAGCPPELLCNSPQGGLFYYLPLWCSFAGGTGMVPQSNCGGVFFTSQSKFLQCKIQVIFSCSISIQFSTPYSRKNPRRMDISTDFSTGCGLFFWRNRISNECSCFVQTVQFCVYGKTVSILSLVIDMEKSL